jgi:hypothetical protein
MVEDFTTGCYNTRGVLFPTSLRVGVGVIPLRGRRRVNGAVELRDSGEAQGLRINIKL